MAGFDEVGEAGLLFGGEVGLNGVVEVGHDAAGAFAGVFADAAELLAGVFHGGLDFGYLIGGHFEVGGVAVVEALEVGVFGGEGGLGIEQEAAVFGAGEGGAGVGACDKEEGQTEGDAEGTGGDHG